jgi:hypothetical protein
MTDFRSVGHRIVPPWISKGREDKTDGAKTWEAHLTLLDDQTARARNGLLERFPDFAGDDAIPYLCRDRRIIRGFAEPRPSINARLKAWRQAWRAAGSAFGLMREIRAYLTGYPVELATVDNAGNWYAITSKGQEVYWWSFNNWNWDGHPELWSRFWLIIYPGTTGLWQEDGTWDDPGVWDDGGTWDTTATIEQVSSIREIVRQRKPAGTTELWTIVAFDASSFSILQPEPDGAWGAWGKPASGSPVVHSRLETASYWDGTSHLEIGS